MAIRRKKGVIPKKRVPFRLDAPDARETYLVGDFNHWDVKAHMMKRDKQGLWAKVLMLKPGEYQYKFLVDGQWCNDPRNDQVVPNCFGTSNNVVKI